MIASLRLCRTGQASVGVRLVPSSYAEDEGTFLPHRRRADTDVITLRTSVRNAYELLPSGDRSRYWIALAAQIALALVDLLGVVLLGVVGLVAGSASSGQPLPARVTQVLDSLGLGGHSSAELALILAAAAALLLVLKSVASLLLQRGVFRFLSRRTTAVAEEMTERFFSEPLLVVQERPSHWTSYALTEGLSNAVTGILSQALAIAGDLALLIVLSAALLWVDPLTTIVSIVYFGVVVLLLNRRLGAWAARVSAVRADSAINSRGVIQDAITGYRELTVSGRRGYFRQRILNEQQRLAEATADTMYINAVPRYGMEAALVVGAALMVAVLLLTRDTQTAVGGLFLFLAAASRVVPALLRLNASTIGLRANEVSAERTFILMDELRQRGTDERPAKAAESVTRLEGAAIDTHGPCSLSLTDVSLQYPGRDVWALVDVSLTLPAGRSMALVGPTGAGKTSLADVVLGVVSPTTGSALINGLPPEQFIAAHPGTVAYVPQDVTLIHGSVRVNVALGLEPDVVSDDDIWIALERAHLASFVHKLSAGLDTPVGERGVRLSGGQRQRLGLARALYRPPQLLVLDEATSALDAETERAVADTITSLGHDVTTVTVAHRLATIRHVDIVVYLESGSVIATGSFDDVRRAVPQFERQAGLLGLTID